MRELWDACDCQGNLLGFDLVKGEPFPPGACQRVAEVWAFTQAGELLLTQRAPGKVLELQWEVTAGAVQKGESPAEGAARELREETGVLADPEELRPLYTCYPKDNGNIPILYCAYFLVRQAFSITLREGETVDFRFLPFGELEDFVQTGVFAEPLWKRFLRFRPEIEEKLRVLLPNRW